MAAALTAADRDKQTAKATAGVWLSPGHWASATVHAFHRWTGETSLLTWCGIEANTADGARLTTDLISCVACPEGSLKAFRA